MQIRRYESGKRMSQAVVHNGFAFLAGQVAGDPSQDVKGQTTQILARFSPQASGLPTIRRSTT
jgi:enamine deaminase RidA (YjgF/YER057c/UK114 family)